MTAKEPLLKVLGLTKRFGGVIAVQDVDLTVEREEIVALIGPNGAGKTTLFNMITAVVSPTKGHVFFEGREITRLKPHSIARLGMTRTFQNLQLFENMTVIENVMTGAHLRLKTGMLKAGLRFPSVRKEEIDCLHLADSILEEFGLSGVADQPASILSYGTQKIVEIARAYAANPKLILLDEPMAGLNPQESKELVQILLKLRRKGIAFLFVEHDMDTVMSIADRIVVLDNGIKIAEGTPEQIARNPQVIAAYLGEDDEEKEALPC